MQKEEITKNFKIFEEKMIAEGLHESAIKTFEKYYFQLCKGHSGLLDKSQIDAVDNIAEYNEINKEAGPNTLNKTIMIKLNGGLGTSMGMTKAKALLPVKNDMTFLDIVIKQILHFRETYKSNLPLIFMNSYNTQQDTLNLIAKYEKHSEANQNNIPFDFLQNKILKINSESLLPAEYPKNPSMEWCPPGHGDIYTAMVTSGLLYKLLEKGIEYAFISNVDNLGAVMDTKILEYFASGNYPFLMEVTNRTEADKKGGHLARLKNRHLTLRESAQCPESEKAEFENVSTYKYFNTNNLWLNLNALAKILNENDNIIELPMIKNSKTVNPTDSNSAKVFQLETAMGAAISVFDGSTALNVPRTRFAPVKKCSDLLGIWSDAYSLTENFQVIANPKRKLPQIVISLDDKFYKLIDDMQARFPKGAPSLIDCERLEVEGDVLFLENVKINGNCKIENNENAQKVIANTKLGK